MQTLGGDVVGVLNAFAFRVCASPLLSRHGYFLPKRMAAHRCTEWLVAAALDRTAVLDSLPESL